MTPSQKKELKSLVVTQIKSLKKDITLLQEKVKPVSPDKGLGRLTRLEAMNEMEINKKLLQDATSRFNRLEYALRKVDSDEYGICALCEELIPFERLKIMPESTICVDCASQR